jgi:hypothetical protein
MFSSAQSGHFVMAAAFTSKSFLLHDHEQPKKIQPEVKQSCPQIVRFVSRESFQTTSYLRANVPYASQKVIVNRLGIMPGHC